MVKWIFVCDSCGVEAPVASPVGQLPRAWLHRTIVDQSSGDVRHTLALAMGTLERHRHYCPACKASVAA